MALFASAKSMKRRAEWLASQTYVVLAIQVSKDNEKTPLSAEQFFAALHGIYRNDPDVQEHMSFEIVAARESIIFYVFTPIHLRDFVEGQLYAQYPDLQINQVTDYTREVALEGMHVATTRIELNRPDVYPIKTYAGTELDPLASLTAVMAGLEPSERIWLQIVVKPVGDEWQARGVTHVKNIRSGKKPVTQSNRLLRLGIRVVQEFASPGAGVGEAGAAKEPPKLSAPEEAALKGIETKITKLGFEVVMRLVVICPDIAATKSRTQSVMAAMKQYNTTNLNGFKSGEIKIDDFPTWEHYITRQFEEKGAVLNIEEIASVYHFPSKNVETSAISWAGSKKGEAPFNLPIKGEVSNNDLTILGRTDFRNSSKEFGIKMDDRKRHMYVIGKSGTGKSTLLENMLIDDVLEGRGVIVVDPHGELADKVIDAIPAHRIKDVIIFDPSDREFPVAFNLLEQVGEDFKGIVASGFVGILKKIFGNSWGPRLEYILRNAALALLDSPNSTMLGIPRMLTEPGFRNKVLESVQDPVIRDFWLNEWARMDAKQQSEAMAPILNKVGQFLSTSTIRNIVGQPKSSFDVRKIMDEQKILVVNLSKGKIGEDNSALLGAMMITKVQLAAMSRANVPPDQRPDCFLYVDEFQNFATESFATILSEARKYNLGLTVAHQYIKQMVDEVRDAVFGNVGTIVSFRIGGEDAAYIQKEFAPVFDENDLVNLQRGFIYTKLLIDGLAAPAFSAQTLMPRHLEATLRDEVVEWSRSTYAKTRAEAEAEIDETAGFRQRRETEEAAKAAQNILTKGNAAIGIHPPQAPKAAPVPAAAAAYIVPPKPIFQPVQQVENEQTADRPNNTGPVVSVESAPKPLTEPPKPVETEPVQQVEILTQKLVDQAEQGVEALLKAPRKEKPLKIMDGWVYKEVAQKGGLKWFLGEPEKEVMEKLEQKRLLKEEQKMEAESPVISSPSEQRANGESAYSEPVEEAILHMPAFEVPQVPQQSGNIPSQNGESVSLL